MNRSLFHHPGRPGSSDPPNGPVARSTRSLCVAMVIALATPLMMTAPSSAQQNKHEPSIGYLYPAGGRRGTSLRVLVGGQFLGPSARAFVSGRGVDAKVLVHYRPLRNLDGDQRELLNRRMGAVAQARWDELVQQGRATGKPPFGWIGVRPPKPAEQPSDKGAGTSDRKSTDPSADASPQPVELPRHFLLDDWEQKSLRELAAIRERLTDRSRRQPNPQIEDTLLVELTIAPDAGPGDRELRILTPMGLTNPMIFQVGTLPEVLEVESNDPGRYDPLPGEPAIETPVVLNGQVLPGDVDRIRFKAVAGRRMVARVSARQLSPFMADAVPGWFQPTLRVLDDRGRELAYADDWQFDPDPALAFDPPDTGEYQLEIRDSIDRGREDFVYRLTLGPLPFVTAVFPLGAPAQQPATAQIEGWNLPTDRLRLPPLPEGVGVIFPTLDRLITNPLRFHSDTTRSTPETEPNDLPDRHAALDLPVVIDGRIGRDGDTDCYRIQGKKGQRIVARVTARQLGSPLDSLLRVTDSRGNVVAWNDDHADKQGHLHRTYGTFTHQADSYLDLTLPADDGYDVQISDATGHGGSARAYRLYLGPPRPDFTVMLATASLTLPTGMAAPITLHILRHEGFDSPIQLELIDAPEGFRLDSRQIPAGRDLFRTTITAPASRPAQPAELVLRCTAVAGGRSIVHPAVPAEDLMQAFLWRHLVPRQHCLAAVVGPARVSAPPTLDDPATVLIKPGQPATVRVTCSTRPGGNDSLELTPLDPPPGIALGKPTLSNGRLHFDILAQPGKATPGLRDNLVVEAWLVSTFTSKDGREGSRRRSLGCLPAVPIRVQE